MCVGVGLRPTFDGGGAVDGVAVEDEDHLLPGRLADKPGEELDEHLGDEALLEDHELHLALVGDRRDDVGGEPLPRALDDRRLPDRRPRPASGVVGAKPGLVSPQDPCFLAAAALRDRRVLDLEPLLDRDRVLLERAPRRLLRAEPPRRADSGPPSSR